MSAGGGKGSQTTTTTSKPPEFAVPFIKDLLNRASDLSDQPLSPPLPGAEQRVAPLTTDELLAQNLLRQRGLFGSPEVNAAKGFVIDNVSGAPFDPVTNALVNRAQGDLVDQFNTNIAPSTAARFQSGGNLDSTAFAETDAAQRFSLARALGDVDANIRGQARQFALGAAGLAPTLAQEDFRNIAGISTIGRENRALDQAFRDVNFQNILAARDEPFQRLDALRSAIASATGGFGTRTTTQPSTGNPFLGALGTAAGLASLIPTGGASAGALPLGGFFNPGVSMGVLSDRATKEDITDAPEVLDDIKTMPIHSWKYKGDDETRIGPMADDFNERFYDRDKGTIDIVTSLGVLYKAVQELTAKVERLEDGAV